MITHSIKSLFTRKRHIHKWQIYLYGGIMFTVGIFFAILLLSGQIKIPQIFATSSWNQTDWSSGVGASTTNQYSSGSNINHSTNGETKFTNTTC